MITDTRAAVVIPNLNGEAYLAVAIDSLLAQTHPTTVIVVENASTDTSLQLLKTYKDKIVVIENEKNLGFAGGVNTGIRYALDHHFELVALFNNDAIADPTWLAEMITVLDTHSDTSIVTCRLELADGTLLDSTGEFYTTWGLPYPRGRGESTEKFQDEEYIFGASGGASIYRAELFKKIGLFDETFFAYYEDTDISFRAQLAGVKIRYSPTAIARHRQGETSKRMPGDFTVYQTFKNLPLLFTKNVPSELLFSIGVRFYFAYFLIFAKAVVNGKGVAATQGVFRSITLFSHALSSRSRIQKDRTVTREYINSIIIHDLPPDQTGLRKLRRIVFRK